MMMIFFKLPEGSEQSGRPILSSKFHRTSSDYIFERVFKYLKGSTSLLQKNGIYLLNPPSVAHSGVKNNFIKLIYREAVKKTRTSKVLRNCERIILAI